MKPNEFDELIRRKFDQNEFAYNPANWEKLEGRMDRKATRRKILMWLPLAPVAYISSIAASLAMIITIPVLIQHRDNNSSVQQNSASVTHITTHNTPVQTETTIEETNNNINKDIVADSKPTNSIIVKNDIRLTYAANKGVFDTRSGSNNNPFNFNSAIDDKNINVRSEHQRSFSGNDFVYGSMQDNDGKRGRTSISVIGGVNYGSTMNGYSFGANGKRMLNDKLYVESDVAFVDNNGIQNMLSNPTSSTATAGSYPVQISENNGNPGAVSSSSGAPTNNTNTAGISFVSNAPPTSSSVTTVLRTNMLAGARIVSATDPVAQTGAQNSAMPDIHRTRYDLYYAQVTPAVGYHIHKNLSVGVGADVQRLLQGDNTLSTGASATTASDIAADNKLVPGFDVGLIGKTEVTITDKIKASVYYRQGMNNVIISGNKYLDRSYLQVHLKFTIFKK